MNFKNVVIFGDSYSTFENYIPAGYAVYYYEGGRPGNDVMKVSDTWWHMLLSETNSNLVLNNSWSGSTIGYRGYNNVDCSKKSSFITRFEKLLSEGFFEKNQVDSIFVFGGTNDSWAGVEVGELQFSDFEREELFTVLPAVCYFFKRITEALPDVTVYCLINTELNPKISEGLRGAALHYGITPIAFDKIDKVAGHPTLQGMKDIKNGILSALK